MLELKKSNIQINVRKISQDVFGVKSHSSDTEYEVNIKTGSCTCPHYKFRLAPYGGTCKHHADVIKYLEEITLNNASLFDSVEDYIRNKNNNVDWNDLSVKFGDDAINEMLKLGMLFKQSRGKLGVLE